MKSFKTILNDLRNKPMLCTESYAKGVLEALESNDKGFFLNDNGIGVKVNMLWPEIEPGELPEEDDETVHNEPETKATVAIVEIVGGLTYRPQMCSGLSSYQEIKEVMLSLAEDANIHTIVMIMDSPGGVAYGCFEAAKSIRKALDDTGTKLIAYVDGEACSAGYALTCIAHEIIANPMSGVGSIGVVIAVENDLPKEIMEGSQRIFITYGTKKRPFQPDGTLTEDFINKLQSSVDKLGSTFVNHVSAYRSLSESEIKATEADSFSAEEALSLGLIDKIMEKDEFNEYLNQLILTKETEKLTDKVKSEEFLALQAKLDEVTATLAAVTEINKQLEAENEKAISLLVSVDEAKKAEAKTSLQQKLSEFSFVGEHLESLTNVLFSMEDETRSLIESVLESANVKSEVVKEEVVPEASSNSEMFKTVSLRGESSVTNEPSGDVYAMVANLLQTKNGAKK